MIKKKLSTILILILLTSLVVSVFLGTLEMAKADNQSSDSNGNPDSWPMFHNNLSHTGTSSSTAPTTSQILWKYTTAGSVSSSPAVANGMLYVGSQDHRVYALNATTGAQIWNRTTGAWVESSPAVANGVVYVGSDDGNVTALNAATGASIWNYTTLGAVVSSPAVTNGIVYVGSLNDYVYALNATTGAQIWNYKTGSYVESSPAVADGMVYFGSYDNYFYCLNASTGAKIWSEGLGGGVEWSPPAVSNGMVYVGTENVPGYGGGIFYCLNGTTGAAIWTFTGAGLFVDSSPAVSDGKVYVSDDVSSYSTNYFYCLNATTGANIWTHTTAGYSSEMFSSPAVADGMVYVGDTNNYFYCLNASTGVQVWSYLTGGGVPSSPAVANGVVYVGSDDGKVYAFGQPQPHLQIRADSPVNILVTEKNGHRVGSDASGNVFNEISGATYTGPGSEPQIITLPGSNTGTFLLQLYATGNGPYTITVTNVALDGSTLGTKIWTGTVNQGDTWGTGFIVNSDGSVSETNLFTVPEYVLGSLIALVACFAAFVAYKKRSSLPPIRRNIRVAHK